MVGRQKKTLAGIIGLLLILLSLYTNRNYMRPGYFERYFDAHYLQNTDFLISTTDPFGENTPIWSQWTLDTFKEKVVTHPQSPSQVKIDNISIKPRDYAFTAESADESWITIRTIYYPGWQVSIDGQPAHFGFEQAYLGDNLGQLLVVVPAGKHQIEVWFGETSLRKLFNAVSLAAWLWGKGEVMRQVFGWSRLS